MWACEQVASELEWPDQSNRQSSLPSAGSWPVTFDSLTVSTTSRPSDGTISGES